MCDLYDKFPGIKDCEWGFYKCTKKQAMAFYFEVFHKYPYLSHMWLHSKDMKEEWLLDELDPNGLYSPSTWIYHHIRDLMKFITTIT